MHGSSGKVPNLKFFYNTSLTCLLQVKINIRTLEEKIGGGVLF